MEIAEFIMKIIMIASISFGVLGFIVQSTSFQGDIKIYDYKRLSYDFARTIMAAPCLAEKNGDEVVRGVFLANKLDELSNTAEQNFYEDFCLKFDPEKKFKIYIVERIESGSGEIWEIGSDSNSQNFKVIGQTMNPFMIAVKHSYTDKIIPAVMYIYIGEEEKVKNGEKE